MIAKMKQKRKYHDISDDENNTSINSLHNSNTSNKRMKISQSAMLPEIDPEEDEVWLVQIPCHINPDDLHDKKVS